MTFLDRLERRYARFAIPGLIRYVVVINVLVYFLMFNVPNFGAMIALNGSLIMQGQVWRLVSWIFLPVFSSIFGMFCYLMFYRWIGDLLEMAWGTFRLNVYYFLGMVLCVLSALIFGVSGGNILLTSTLLLAVATIEPNLEILLFYILPIKIKWVALIGLLLPLDFIFLGALPDKIMAILCLGNYLLFFGPQFLRHLRDRGRVQIRRAQFEAASDTSPYLHRCETCGITELTHPYADFRVTDDGREFCMEHLPAQSPLTGAPPSHN